MYRGTPSSIFDVPEFPTLRRVKPLPKRRRTTSSSDTGGNETLLTLSPAQASALAAQGASILQQSAAAAALLGQHQGEGQGQGLQSLDSLGPNPTPEELIAHADTLSARMALQNYYMPILGSVQNLLASATHASSVVEGANNDGSADPNGNNTSSTTTAAAAAAAALAAVAGAGRNGQLPLPLSELDSVDLGIHFAAAAAAAAAIGGLGSLGLGLPGMNSLLGNINSGQGTGPGTASIGVGTTERAAGFTRDYQEDDRGRDDSDYVDHLRQPGNTKKRKVPANASPRGNGLAEGRPGSPLSSYLDDEGLDITESIEDLQLQLHLQREREMLERDRERERDRDRDHYHRDRSRSREDYSPSRTNHPAYHHHSRSNSSNSNPSNNHGYTYTGTTSNPTQSSSLIVPGTSPNSFHLSTLLMYPPPPYPGQLEMLKKKRGKLTAVTLAGLQHKEMLKTRKRQLAAVMGALSHGDTFALDQALASASYGYGVALRDGGAPPITPTTGSSGGHDAEIDEDVLDELELGEGQGQLVLHHQGPGIRMSKRRNVRMARAMKVLMDLPERRVRHPDAVPFPEGEFEFHCHSGKKLLTVSVSFYPSTCVVDRTGRLALFFFADSVAAERLSATKDEVATLRKRFEAEFEKQAIKAAKMAAAAANNVTNVIAPAPTTLVPITGEKPSKVAKASGGKGKRERQERDRERAERAQAQIQQQQKAAEKNSSADANAPSGKENVNVSAQKEGSQAPVPSGKSKGGKKKKRSALANASNPHHLRNYVPSRLPHSDGHGHHNSSAGANTNSNTVWPLPVKFLSAEIPPKSGGGGKKGSANRNAHSSAQYPPGSNIPLTYPGEEWICPFCEYDLFYGGDAEYRRAVRNRKKILKRRRRARERAARAASGVKTTAPAATAPPPAPVAPPPSEEGEEEDEGYGDEEVYEEVVGPGEDGRQFVGAVGGGTGRWKGGGGADG
ncbi:hypothetical protein CVT26_003776 [Gymnopilus dilepis]|uniref:Uncharacterized protein n=1 Tax=Gymnopilus dilepis TaxID=231916 RepID=A0A409W1R8_9AGAR|nr:hypothetical protein CVT26_003776 [Gymnopilus dilepis]